ncbi:MAG: DNA-binding protein WhiA [Oscillospiraceae bacterium]|jgi:DNA-binding protein WhiA|nr:DNA-binding protein WhiA [Oscillospiraceae bacterium]
MPSFSATVKRELCRAPIKRSCCAQSECYGALLLGNTFRAEGLRVLTSHTAFAERLPPLFAAAFGILPPAPSRPEHGGKWLFAVTGPKQVQTVRGAYGYGAGDDTVLHLNNAVLEQECCQASFWRGAFLSGGTVTDPLKKYLLEIVTPHRVLSRQLSALLRESGLEASLGERAGVQVLALKVSEAIEDFLALTGAPLAAMAVMQAKLEKEIRNSVNRRVNCDTANVDKALAAAERLRGVIMRLEKTGQMDGLPEMLKETARARIAYPEDSMAQLADRLGVGKSCLNHRLRKLAELAGGKR